eukprot:7761898-Karenia_brevis.AAC.1
MKALRGWTKLDPGFTRPPIPLTFATLIVVEMLKLDRKAGLMARLAILTMFFAYLRPAEATSILEADLVDPVSGGGPFVINLFPKIRGQTSKVGMTDEAIVLDSKDA